jgi:hypothetical protein
MTNLPGAFRAALVAVAAMLPLAGGNAAAPDLIDPEPPAIASDYSLDTVLVVHNWILCVSESSAERLAKAREESAAVAAGVYAELAAAKSCGRFAKLGVMLKQSLYRSGPGSHDTRVFSALVNIGVGWQSGYVVAGLPE